MGVLQKTKSAADTGQDSSDRGKNSGDGTEPLSSMPLLNLLSGREAILDYFENTWALTELLFSSLVGNEAYYRRPYHKTRHPMIFYYAHPVCFYVNKLLVSGLLEQPVNQHFELLFEVGVDEMNWDDLREEDNFTWPPMDEVRSYRDEVYKLIKDLIIKHPVFAEPVTQDRPSWALAMGFEHERIHLETSSVLIRELPVEYVTKPPAWPGDCKFSEGYSEKPEAGKDFPDENELVLVEESTVSRGKPRTWPSFGWDNEYGRDQRHVPSFKASKCLISNGEFYQFVRSGGYENAKYWSKTGWAWRQFRNIKWPTFWKQDGPAGSHRYRLRTTFEVIDMQWDWPAIVNFYEAKAYCIWLAAQDASDSSFRLLREGEHLAMQSDNWEAAFKDDAGGHPLLCDAVMQEQDKREINHNLAYGGESPVNALPASVLGFHDVVGNVWQWSEGVFNPLPEFEIHPYYTDFSTPCFDGEHQMILGGSFISTGDEASIWSRFHFRPHFFQQAGFRIVQSLSNDVNERGDKYETDALVNQYLLFHYGSSEEQRDEAITARAGHPETSNLIERTVELMNQYASGKTSALDLGCAVGRASFELSRSFNEVLAIDYSEAFIEVGQILQREGTLEYQRRETGNYFSTLTATVSEDVERNKVRFLQGDAMDIVATKSLSGHACFDAILLSNLMCRLSSPATCLLQFVNSNTYLASGGILVIASPNTWMSQYTDPNKFLDGLGSEDTLAAMAKILQGFELVHEEDLPFMIREHRRKYEYIVNQVSVWQKC